MKHELFSNKFVQYILQNVKDEDKIQRLPSLNRISKELNVSVSTLREQLEAAKALGFVEARPRAGIRRLPYQFLPAVRESLNYGLNLDRKYFDQFASLRNHIEASFWHEAVVCLDEIDHRNLKNIVSKAWNKLNASQIEIPHEEHRQLHLLIFHKLNNLFVYGILEAYWEAYEIIGLNLYTDYEYLKKVWDYHEKMVDSICIGDYEAGFQALTQHSDLLYHRPLAAQGNSTNDE